MDSDIIDAKDSVFSQKEDPYTSIKPDFFADSLTNPNELGFMDISKIPHKSLLHDNADHAPFSDLENPFMKMNPKGDQSPNPRSLMNPSFSPATYFQSHMNLAYDYHHNNFPNNGKSNHSQESFGLTPFRALNKQYDEYYAPFDSQYDHSNPQNIRDYHGQSEMAEEYPLRLLWGNDSSKALKQKLTSTPNEFYQNKGPFATNFIAPGYDNEEEGDEDEESGDAGYGLQDQTAKTQQLFPTKTEPSAAGNSSAPTQTNVVASMNQKGLKTPNKKTGNEEIKTTGKSTPLSKGEEDDGDDSFLDSKHRSSRGLRVLSVKVKDIVGEKKRTSYKEVADYLIQEFSHKLKLKKPGESKDEQNVKRRVYDALNVLIAADILKKDGKAVFCDESLANLGPPKRRKLKEDKEKLEQSIVETKRRYKNKVETIRELVSKCLAIKHLIKRNKERIEIEPSGLATGDQKLGESKYVNEDKENQHLNLDGKEEKEKEVKGNKRKAKKAKAKGKDKEKEAEQERERAEAEAAQAKAKAKMKISSEEIIRFPFIVLLSASIENAMNLNMDTAQRQLSIESKNTFNIFGDIDVLLKMRLDNVPKDFFEENIPSEIRKYLSSSKGHGEGMLS